MFEMNLNFCRESWGSIMSSSYAKPYALLPASESKEEELLDHDSERPTPKMWSTSHFLMMIIATMVVFGGIGFVAGRIVFGSPQREFMGKYLSRLPIAPSKRELLTVYLCSSSRRGQISHDL